MVTQKFLYAMFTCIALFCGTIGLVVILANFSSFTGRYSGPLLIISDLVITICCAFLSDKLKDKINKLDIYQSF